MTLQQFEAHLEAELSALREDLISGSYRPVRPVFLSVPKANGKRRSISLWAIRDRVAQRVVHDHLSPAAERQFLDCSFGFRAGRSVQDAGRAVALALRSGCSWVLDADIEDCFGSMTHDLVLSLVEQLPDGASLLELVYDWLNAPRQPTGRPGVGLPQGAVVSPLLANLVLHRFDQMTLAALPSAILIRFADDFVILSRSEAEAVWSFEVARRSLENIRLRLNLRKTRLLNASEGFSFLGLKFAVTNPTPTRPVIPFKTP